ncbi:MAG: hypothetical protein RQ714_05720 [Nitrosomonas sp.]|nr:hypothetical protein [Nitrosomonas sp.]
MSVVRFRPWPPKFSAQLLSVGRFHLCFPHDTQKHISDWQASGLSQAAYAGRTG